MSQDPMVTALQGQQDPVMDALFPQGKRALNPLDLMLKGQEMLKDPNRPQYDPTNVDRPMIPGEEGSPYNGILQPWSVLSSHPSQRLQHLAGDVVHGPWGAPPRVPLANMGGTEGLLGMTGNIDALNVIPHPNALTPSNKSKVLDIIYPLAPFSK